MSAGNEAYSYLRQMQANPQDDGSSRGGRRWSGMEEQSDPSTSLLQKAPVMLLLRGGGFDSWTEANQRMFLKHHFTTSVVHLRASMEAMIGNKGIYYCSRLYGGVRLGVVSCPLEVSKKSEAKAWLEWLANLLENWTDTKIKAIYNPSEKYDSIVKTATLAAGINGILVKPDAKKTYHYAECVEALKRLAAYKQAQSQKEAPAQTADPEDSDVIEPPSQFPSSPETPLGERKSSDMDIVDLTTDSKEGRQVSPGPSQDQGFPPRTPVEEAKEALRGIFLGQQLKAAAAEWSAQRAQRSEFHPTAHSTERKQPIPPQHQAESSSDEEGNNSDEEAEGPNRPRKTTQKSGVRKMSGELIPLPSDAICVDSRFTDSLGSPGKSRVTD